MWDQYAGLGALGPSASVAEVIVGDWLKELLGIPPDASFAITTGCQMAHVTALAAARHDVLAERGWDVRERGLADSPPITAVAGALRHVTIDRALRLLGIGGAQIVVVPADDAGRMRPRELAAALHASEGPTIVCAQAGEVNTGSYDPLVEIVEIVRETDAWLHVDGAFGLWAAASPTRRALLDGCGDADSWATDGHKWLNVPYDCGLAFCRKPEAHRASMTMTASYFEGQGKWVRDAADWTPESSRRARAFTVYAALRSLGREGWPSSWTAAATSRSASRRRSPSFPAAPSSTRSSSTRCSSASRTTRRRKRCSPTSSGAARRGWAGQRGRAARRSASPSRAGGRRRRTSTAPSPPSSRHS